MSRQERLELHVVQAESLSEGKGTATCPRNEAQHGGDERMLEREARNPGSNLASTD